MTIISETTSKGKASKQRNSMYEGLRSQPPAEHYQELVPDLRDEFSETLKGLIRETRPRTILHTLLEAPDEPRTRESLAVAIDQPTFMIDGVLDALQREGWVVQLVENGFSKYLLKAPRV